MVAIVSQWLGVLGVPAPTCLAEFVPYFLTVMISVFMVALVMRMIISVLRIFLGGYKF